MKVCDHFAVLFESVPLSLNSNPIMEMSFFSEFEA
jgi:hypothetical protein